MSDPANLPVSSSPDAHGEAALLFVESLLHCLRMKGVLTSAEAIDIVQVALDAQLEIIIERSGDAKAAQLIANLLGRIINTLQIDATKDRSDPTFPPND